MANTAFPNIDFKFRCGNLEGYNASTYSEGSLNFVKDQESLYVQKDGLKFKISDVVLDAGTEATIKTLALPKNKIYLSSDTLRFMWFDRKNLVWVYIGSNCENAEVADKAMHDINGNEIVSYYYPRSEAEADKSETDIMIQALEEAVSGISTFEYIVCNTLSDLPEEGRAGVIYLVPTSIWDETAEEQDNNLYVELLWIYTQEYGGFYECVGSTAIDMSNYYSKDEVDNMISSLRSILEGEISALSTSTNNSISSLRSSMNSLQSSTNTRLTAVEGDVTTLQSSSSSQGSTITSLNGRMDTAEGNITTVTNSFSQRDEGGSV